MKRKRKNKIEPNKSTFLKRSLELEAEVGDDSAAYELDEAELEDLIDSDYIAPEDAEEAEMDDILGYWAREEQDELLRWDDDEERFV